MRNLVRFRQVFVLAIVIFVSATARVVATDVWPQRPVHFIVPIVPGSSPDIAARIFGAKLSEQWHQSVIIENRAGAAGLVGTAAFAHMQDDHVFLFSFAAPITVFPATQKNLPYDAGRDVVPISAVADTFGTISASASLKVATLSELVALARSKPSQLNWTSGGGAFPILFEGFLKRAGLDMVQVPYRNQSLAIQDVAEGRVQVIVTPMTAALPLVQAGRIRVLAVTNKRRSPLWPDVPTSIEAGYSDLAFEGLIGIFGPRDTPHERRERISKDLRIIAADPLVAEHLAAAGQVVRAGTPAEFASAIEEQRSQIETIVKFIGMPKQ
jgi:tripartite-type tricarboxylate transporter receptor subunit TctC